MFRRSRFPFKIIYSRKNTIERRVCRVDQARVEDYLKNHPDSIEARILRRILNRITTSRSIILPKRGNALISGGAGFLGSWLAETLALLGYSVTIVDDLSTGRLENIEYALNRLDIELVRGKIEEVDIPEKEWVIVAHLAARPSPEDYFEHPIETMMSNSIGTKRMLDISLKSKPIFLYASTSEVYGHPEKIPTPETCWGRVNPIGPRSPYDESKRFSEALVMAYHRKHGVRTRIARIFNTYVQGLTLN